MPNINLEGLRQLLIKGGVIVVSFVASIIPQFAYSNIAKSIENQEVKGSNIQAEQNVSIEENNTFTTTSTPDGTIQSSSSSNTGSTTVQSSSSVNVNSSSKSVNGSSDATCIVTINGETHTYTYHSDSGVNMVTCGANNGQPYSNNQNIDPQKIQDSVQNTINSITKSF